MIIDWHAHIYTPEEAAGDLGTLDGKHGPKWGERGCPMVLENFLEAHYANGIDISVVTNAAPASGRVLLGNVQVRTSTNILIGSGDVIIESIIP